MEIVEQLHSEAADRAGNPEGFLRLIRLLFQEVEKIDVTSTQAEQQYVALLRAYILVKRRLSYFTKKCERKEIEMPELYLKDNLHYLKSAIKIKRDEARSYAAKNLPPDKLRELNKYAGTHLDIRSEEFASLTDISYSASFTPKSVYRGQMGWEWD